MHANDTRNFATRKSHAVQIRNVMNNGHLGESGDSVLRHVARAFTRGIENVQHLENVALENLKSGNHVKTRNVHQG